MYILSPVSHLKKIKLFSKTLHFQINSNKIENHRKNIQKPKTTIGKINY